MEQIDFCDVKLRTNELERLDIREFKRAGLLNGRVSTDIIFRDGLKVNLNVHAFRPNGYLNLAFPKETGHSDEAIRLETSHCYFGGYRYWFVCSGKGDNQCNNRVGVLYRAGLDFACRRCHNLTYESNATGKSKLYIITRWDRLRSKIIKLIPKVRRRKYAGKATKNNVKLANLMRQYEESKGRVFLTLERMQVKEKNNKEKAGT